MLHIIKPPFILSHLLGIPLGHTYNLISLYTNPPTQGPITHPQSAINCIYPIYYYACKDFTHGLLHRYRMFWNAKYPNEIAML